MSASISRKKSSWFEDGIGLSDAVAAAVPGALAAVRTLLRERTAV